MVVVKSWEIFSLVQPRQQGLTIFSKQKSAFLDDKNKKLKNSKNWVFSKGVSPQFSSKSAKFSIFFFQAKQSREICFTISQQKNASLGRKKQKLKEKKKTGDFTEGGQSMGLLKNLKPCHLLILPEVDQGNVFHDIVERRNASPHHKNETFQKLERLGFFQRGQCMVLIKNWKLSHLFI